MAARFEKDDSVWLCETLKTIGISELIRRKFRSIGTCHEIIRTLTNFVKRKGPDEVYKSTYIFGSSIEGTTVYGMVPDMDDLECDESYPIIDQLSKDHKVPEFLLIKDPDTPSGYAKLQLVRNGLPVIIKEKYKEYRAFDIELACVVDKYGRLVLKNTLTEIIKNNSSSTFITGRNINLETHGPAQTYKMKNSITVDHVHGYRCRSWPSMAKEWIERERRHDWPQQSIIKYFITLGCFVVGVGHHNSTEKDLEWRLSFSLQERELMFGLNDVQHKCYVILKLIKKDVITATVGESITSYHCKTCLFYTIERNPLDIWKPENLFSCVKRCLQLLLEWTTDSYCPNYFIPTENMFDGRIKEKKREQLIEILKEILSEGFGVLSRLKTSKIDKYLQNRGNETLLQSLRRESARELQRIVPSLLMTNIKLAASALRSTLYRNITRNKRQLPCDILDSIRDVEELMKSLSNSVPITEHTVKDTQEVVDFMLPFLHTILASHMASYAMVCTDPTQRTNYIRESKKHYMQGALSDFTSGRLKFLTFLYFCGQYNVCEILLKEYENFFKNNGIILIDYPKKINIVPESLFDEADVSIKDIFQKYVHASVLFLPTEYPLIHEALQFEMFRSFGTPAIHPFCNIWYWYDWAVVDSNVYMYFLWYLLCVKMNKPVLDRFYVIFKLILCTYDFLGHRETAFNLISWICLKEGFIQQAITFLIASWQEVKNRDTDFYPGEDDKIFCDHNAAKWHMLLIMKRLLDNGEIPSGGP